MITLKYKLSETARRAELAAGRDAREDRSRECLTIEYLAEIASLDGAYCTIDETQIAISSTGQVEFGGYGYGLARIYP
jgi:hypothetical protein